MQYIIMYQDHVQKKKQRRHTRRTSRLSVRMSEKKIEISQLKEEIKEVRFKLICHKQVKHYKLLAH